MKTNNKHRNLPHAAHKKTGKRLLALLLVIVCLLPCFVLAASAAPTDEAPADSGSPIDPVIKFKDMIVLVVQIAGGLAALFGLAQFGMSFQSHDPSQRSNGLLIFIGGILIALAPQILSYIGINL